MAGCASEFDIFMAYRRELPEERSASILRHLAGCSLCHDQWKRFELDAHVAQGIQSAIRGDPAGADAGPGWGPAEELPEELQIPGFVIRPGYIEGGQARVYRGTYEASQEEVAIKVFHDALVNEGGARFSREIKSLARLRHPNLITIRSDGVVHGHAYFVMPWVEGLALDEYVRKVDPALAASASGGPMLRIGTRSAGGASGMKSRKVEIDTLVGLFVKICDAVAHAHQRGVMHLDLKPSNVRVDSAGEPIVMDFGLARLSESDYLDSVGGPLGVAGTPLYMAPEQIENRDDLDLRADVFALGLLLYEVLVGRRARGEHWSRASIPSRAMAAEPPPRPRQVNSSVPGEVEAIILRALEPDRNRRYPSARSLADDLAAYRRGAVVSALADRPWYRVRKWLHANKLPIAALGVIIMVMGVGVGFKLHLDSITAEQNEQIERVVQEAGTVAVQSELIRAYEQIEDLALQSGDKELAAKSGERAKAIRARLTGNSDAPAPPPTDVQP